MGKQMMEICKEVDQKVIRDIEHITKAGQLKNFVDGKYESYGKIDLLAYKESEDYYFPGTSVIGTKPGTAEGEPELIRGVDHVAKPVGTKEANVPRGHFVSSEEAFPAGSIHIDMAQPMANLAFYCLEPQTRDGFMGWGLLDEYLMKSGANRAQIKYPVFKYYSKIQ